MPPERYAGRTDTDISNAALVRVRDFIRRHHEAKRIEAALYSWQQTCDEQERELAAMRGALDKAQLVVDTFTRKPTEGHVRDVVGLAESLRRYREMVYGSPEVRLPRAR